MREVGNCLFVRFVVAISGTCSIFRKCSSPPPAPSIASRKICNNQRGRRDEWENKNQITIIFSRKSTSAPVSAEPRERRPVVIAAEKGEDEAYAV